MAFRLLSSAVKLLREPIGICIFDDVPKSIKKLRVVFQSLDLEVLATVGDVVTLNVIKYWRVPDIAIIDNRTLREKKIDTLSTVSVLFKDIIRLHNEPSTISDRSFDSIETATRLVKKGRNVLVVVDGEEDVLAILLILNVDRGLVVYGNYFRNCLTAIPTVGLYKLAALKLLAQFRR
ncbi:MAG: DUF359 domain-containing protein [Crenarchaeota archaeon]|nr:DUF359 domain-containing protein [Thermoproteota archaeon]